MSVSPHVRLLMGAWLVCLATVGADVGVAATASGAASASDRREPRKRTSVEEVSRVVVCPTCETTLDRSEGPAASAMLRIVERRVEQGWERDRIVDSLVAEYGGDESIRAVPEPRGLGLLAWLVPAIVVGSAVVAGAVLVRSWRR